MSTRAASWYLVGGVGLYGASAYGMYTYLTAHKLHGDGDKSGPEGEASREAGSGNGARTYDAIAKKYDSAIGGEEFSMGTPLLRRWILNHAKGDVLEISAGTGRNLTYYSLDSVRSLTLADLSMPMLEIAEDKFYDELKLAERYPGTPVKFCISDAHCMTAAEPAPQAAAASVGHGGGAHSSGGSSGGPVVHTLPALRQQQRRQLASQHASGGAAPATPAYLAKSAWSSDAATSEPAAAGSSFSRMFKLGGSGNSSSSSRGVGGSVSGSAGSPSPGGPPPGSGTAAASGTSPDSELGISGSAGGGRDSHGGGDGGGSGRGVARQRSWWAWLRGQRGGAGCGDDGGSVGVCACTCTGRGSNADGAAARCAAGVSEAGLPLSRFAPSSFDTVVDAFGLCSHEDPVQVLREVARVVRPDGRILLLEHGRGHYDFMNRWLDDGAHKHHAKWGCWWNRDIEEIIEEAGLQVTKMSRWHFGTTYICLARPKLPTDSPAAPETS